MTRTLLAAIFLTLFSHTAWADSRLDDQDDKILAAQCAKARPSHKREFAYYPAEIVSIGKYGAAITQVVRRKFWQTAGGNNGWGKERKYTTYMYVECFWHNVRKGEYNIAPAYALYHYEGGELPHMVAYAEQSYTNLSGEFVYEKDFYNFDGEFEPSSFYAYFYAFSDEASKAYDSRKFRDFGLWSAEGHQ
jgi:hypothetical protein